MKKLLLFAIVALYFVNLNCAKNIPKEKTLDAYKHFNDIKNLTIKNELTSNILVSFFNSVTNKTVLSKNINKNSEVKINHKCKNKFDMVEIKIPGRQDSLTFEYKNACKKNCTLTITGGPVRGWSSIEEPPLMVNVFVGKHKIAKKSLRAIDNNNTIIANP